MRVGNAGVLGKSRREEGAGWGWRQGGAGSDAGPGPTQWSVGCKCLLLLPREHTWIWACRCSLCQHAAWCLQAQLIPGVAKACGGEASLPGSRPARWPSSHLRSPYPSSPEPALPQPLGQLFVFRVASPFPLPPASDASRKGTGLVFGFLRLKGWPGVCGGVLLPAWGSVLKLSASSLSFLVALATRPPDTCRSCW